MRLRLPSPAMVVAVAALVVASTGSAIAAKHYLITSTTQISPKVLKQLRGAQGPAGPAGAAGKNGTSGTSGSNGANGSNGVNGTNGVGTIAVLASSQTESGVFADGGGATGGYLNPEISFVEPLPAPLDLTHVIETTAVNATHCPGVGHADPGYLCLYRRGYASATFNQIYSPNHPGDGADVTGAAVFYNVTGAGAYVDGTWSVTAP